MVQPDVEPHGRVERAVLVRAEPRQLVVERVGVRVGGEVALGLAPVGDGPRDAVDELAEAVLALPVLRRAVAAGEVAVEVLRGDDVRRELAPRRRKLDVLLLEDDLARVALDGGVARAPLDAVERVGPSVEKVRAMVRPWVREAGVGGVFFFGI